jgi:hypothetical protein
MASDWVTIPTKGFQGGIDQVSAESALREGCVEDARNIDFTSDGYMRKRKGFKTPGDYLPLIANSIQQVQNPGDLPITGYFAKFRFGSGVDLYNISKQLPVNITTNKVVSSTDFATVTEYFYTESYPSEFVSTPSGTNFSIAAADHLRTSADFFVMIYEWDNSRMRPLSLITTATVEINVSTLAINISGLTTGKTIKVVIVDPLEYGGYSSPSFTGSFTLTRDIHKVQGNTIAVVILKPLVGSVSYVQQGPLSEDILIKTNGTIQTNISAYSYKFFVIPAEVVERKVGTSGVFPIELSTHFPILQSRLGEDTRNHEDVTITIDTVTNEGELTYGAGSGASSYVLAFVKPNVRTLYVPAQDALNTRALLSQDFMIYGLDLSICWNINPGTSGVFAHTEQAGQYPICLIENQLFEQESNTGISYFTNLLRIHNTDAATYAPCFINSDDTTNRWRKQIQTDGVSGGTRRGTSIAYNSGTSLVEFTFNSTYGFTEVGSGTNSIVAGKDYLTISGASNSINNGTFRVSSYSLGANTLVVSVEIPEYDRILSEMPSISLSQFDEVESGFLGGILSDYIPTLGLTSTYTSSSYLLPGDILTINNATYSVAQDSIANFGTKAFNTTVTGVTSAVSLDKSDRLYFTRESSTIVPIRSLNGEFPVLGDVLSLEDASEVKVVQPPIRKRSGLGEFVVSGVDDGVINTLTFFDASIANKVEVGDTLILIDADDGIYSREVTVESLTGENTITVTSLGNSRIYSGYIQCMTLTIDREIELVSESILQTTNTWQAVYPPTDLLTSTPTTIALPITDSSSGFTSVKSGDSTYICSDSNPMLKYDGSSVYEAGLPKWQSSGLVFAELAGGTSPLPSQITVSVKTDPSGAGSTKTNKLISQSATTKNYFKINDMVKINSSGGPFYAKIVDAVTNASDITTYTIDSTITEQVAAFNIDKVSVFSYYARFSYTDINNQVTVSAPTGVDDLVVYRTSTNACVLKFIVTPPNGFRDYDRVTIEIYRTKENGVVPYLVEKNIVSFSGVNGYYYYKENTYDNTLSEAESLPVLENQSLNQGLQPPPSSLSSTALDNGIVVGNIVEPQNIEIQVVPTDTTSASTYNATYLTIQDDTTTQKYEFTTTSYDTTSITESTSGGKLYVEFVTNSTVVLNEGDYVYIMLYSGSTASPETEVAQYAGWQRLVSGGTGDGKFEVDEHLAGGTTIKFKVVMQSVSSSNRIPVYIGSVVDLGMSSLATSSSLGLASIEFRMMLMLSMAINAVQVVESKKGTLQFRPFITAFGGNYFQKSGYLRIESTSTSLAVKFNGRSSYIPKWYVNGVEWPNEGQLAYARARVFPSRVVKSKKNFPEVFDSCFIPSTVAILPNEVMDINPTDGQEITAIAPAFGESVSGTSRQSSALAVFKTESIYLVDMDAKEQVKIESGALGCTATRSVVSTKQGVMFANNSGIYRLGSDRKVVWVGRYIDRIWKEAVDRTRMNEMVAVHDPSVRAYRLSVPFIDGNWYVLTYFYDNEEQGQPGAWSVYSGMRATGWAQFADASYFCTDLGQVFQLREDNQPWDYRDDTEAISAYAILKAEGFGDTGIRKVMKSFRLHFRNYKDMNNTSVYTAVNLKNNFIEADNFKVDLPYDNTYLSDQETRKIDVVKFTSNTRKFTFFQVKVTNDGLDETMEVVQADYRVSGLSDDATTDAASTTK